MPDHDTYDAMAPSCTSEHDPGMKCSMIRELPETEECVAKLLLLDTNGESDKSNSLVDNKGKFEKSILNSQSAAIDQDLKMNKNAQPLLAQLPEEDNDKKEDSMSQQLMHKKESGADYPQCIGLDIGKKSNFFYPQIYESENLGKTSPHPGMQSDQRIDSDTSYKKEGKYFHYDKPLYEDTGYWIPVSVPPMSESEHEEWTKGFCSNGGYIPEGDLELNGEDKELTLWDIVVEMLLAARGKVNALATGDIHTMSWISEHLMEQAWREMAQTLTEATFGNTQEILESGPPKWLPDSAANTCMLCNVRFHPFLCTRHHCRYCGGIFCGDCSKGRSLLPVKFRAGDPQRVCDVCCVRLQSVQPYLMDQVSRASQLPTHDLTDLSTLRSWVNFPWGQSMEYEIYKAANTIRGYNKVGYLMPEKKIPEAILQHAKGLAILSVVKVGMMVTYKIGTGLVVARREDGTWSPPSAISSFGVGWGAQAGGELTDFIVVLRSIEAVKTFSGDAHLSVGAGLSAAFGIVGRTAEADLRAGTGGYAACYTYSCSKGAFVGCSLEGSIVTTRAQENSRFYGSQSITSSHILLGSLPRPPAAAVLYRALGDLYRKL